MEINFQWDEVTTDYGTSIDLLGVDNNGSLVVIELKKDKASREVLAQMLEYGAWVSKLDLDRIDLILRDFQNKFKNKISKTYDGMGDLFKQRFDSSLDEVDLNATQKYILVAKEIDDKLLDVIDYLKDYGINVHIILYDYLRIGNDNYFTFLKITKGTPETTSASRVQKIEYYRRVINEKIKEYNIEIIFNYTVERLNEIFDYSRPQQSTYTFYADLKEGRRAVLRINVDESNSQKGLKIEIYTKRFANFLNINNNEIKELIPTDNIEKFQFSSTTEEYSGIAWYAKNEAEIDEFVENILRIKNKEDNEEQ